MGSFMFNIEVQRPLHNTTLHKMLMRWITETKKKSHIQMIFDLVSCDLSISIILLHMVLQFRITIPLVTCTAMSIIFLNERCSKAWIGWATGLLLQTRYAFRCVAYLFNYSFNGQLITVCLKMELLYGITCSIHRIFHKCPYNMCCSRFMAVSFASSFLS